MVYKLHSNKAILKKNRRIKEMALGQEQGSLPFKDH